MFNNYQIENASSGTQSQRIEWFEYFYMLMLILYAGMANKFFLTYSITENPIGVILPVVLSGILALRRRLVFDRRFYLLLFMFGIYFIAVSIKFYVIQPTFIINYFFLFFIVYCSVRALKHDFFIIYEYLIFLFAIASLFFWSVQIALGGDTLFNILSRFSILVANSFVSGEGVNALIYSVQSYETTLINNFTIPRNCGFAWEPGAFAVYLCLAIFINFFIIKNDKSRKLRFWVMALALITTQSTTGYTIFILIVVFHLFNSSFRRFIMILPVAIAVIIFVFSLPFMKDKILDLIAETGGINELLFDAYKRESPVTPQRFTSFLITMVDFKNNPILGLASHREEVWTYKIGSNISPISGIGNLLAQFGIVGALFFLIVTLKSSFFISRYFKYPGRILLFLVIILISVSYTIIFIPLLMCFWMFYLFSDEEERKKADIGQKPVSKT